MLKPVKLSELLSQSDFGRNKLYATLERNINKAIFTDARIEVRDIPLRKAERLSKEARKLATEFIYVFYRSPIMNSTIPSPQTYKLNGTNSAYKTIAGKIKTGKYMVHGEFDSFAFSKDFIPAYLEEVKKGLKYDEENVVLLNRVPGNNGEATLRLRITENGHSKITTAKTPCEDINKAINGTVVIPRESYRSHNDFMDKLHKLFRVDIGFFTFRKDVMAEKGEWIDVEVAPSIINYHGTLRVLTSTSAIDPAFHPGLEVANENGAVISNAPTGETADSGVTSGATPAGGTTVVTTDENPSPAVGVPEVPPEAPPAVASSEPESVPDASSSGPATDTESEVASPSASDSEPSNVESGESDVTDQDTAEEGQSQDAEVSEVPEEQPAETTSGTALRRRR